MKLRAAKGECKIIGTFLLDQRGTESSCVIGVMVNNISCGKEAVRENISEARLAT